MGLDISGLRARFPVFAARPAPFHYLDSAATGQICAAAADALLAYETTSRANVKRGIDPLAEAATDAFDRATVDPDVQPRRGDRTLRKLVAADDLHALEFVALRPGRTVVRHALIG